jgi:G3E family GTPase
MTEEEKAAQTAEFKRRKETGLFKDIFRSKGFFWLASRNNYCGGWSQAGMIGQISNEGLSFTAVVLTYLHRHRSVGLPME